MLVRQVGAMRGPDCFQTWQTMLFEIAVCQASAKQGTHSASTRHYSASAMKKAHCGGLGKGREWV